MVEGCWLKGVGHAPTGERHPHHSGGAYGPKTEPKAVLHGIFRAPRHPRHSGKARVPKRPTSEL
jgi:hypothetical protein